jgi:flagellum-specific ATP synthase
MRQMHRLRDRSRAITPIQQSFEVAATTGHCISIKGLTPRNLIGDRLYITQRNSQDLQIEIISFDGKEARILAFGSCDRLGPGSRAWSPLMLRNVTYLLQSAPALGISDEWIGRTFDPIGNAIDQRPQPATGQYLTLIRRPPPPPLARTRLGPPLSVGVRAMDLFTTCREGQRLGLFAGSGVGKSSLIAMLARQAKCEIAIIALVGERGREVREFIEDDLGPAGMARSIVVVATSDDPPLLRREAPYAAMAIAEHFRDQGRRVLLIIDSITRLCIALREIALSVGELPAVRGYPSSVFAELPRLLERAGPGFEQESQARQAGSITGLFTVLVEGDDHNEPISDAIRGILDGHIILDRKIAESGRYPAIDILRSLSRSFSTCHSQDLEDVINRARGVLALQAQVTDLVRLGAYQPGTDPEVDFALSLAPQIERLLHQTKDQNADSTAAYRALRDIMSSSKVEAPPKTG